MFIQRRTNPLGRSNNSKRAGSHLPFIWEISGPSSRAGSSTHALQEGQPFLECLHGKFPALRSEISGSQQRDLASEGWPSSNVHENKFYKGFHREARSRQIEPALLERLGRFHVNTTLHTAFTLRPTLYYPLECMIDRLTTDVLSGDRVHTDGMYTIFRSQVYHEVVIRRTWINVTCSFFLYLSYIYETHSLIAPDCCSSRIP